MSLDLERLMLTNELGEIIRMHNQGLDRLRKFRQEYPHLMPPNVANMVEENLKDNVQILLREFNNLNKPRAEQKRYVCNECHCVFGAPLSGGLCDECRARQHRTQPNYEAATTGNALAEAAHMLDEEDLPADAEAAEVGETGVLDLDAELKKSLQ